MKQIGLLVISIIIVLSLLTSVGTYALLSASTTVATGEFSAFSSESINIVNAPPPTSGLLRTRYSTQQITFPMFYDSATYPTGPNPYDAKKVTSPSGEIPGGWAPGDQVTRSWNFQNKGAAAKFTKVSANLKSLTDKLGKSISPGTPAYQDFLKNMKVTVYSPDDGWRNPVFNGTFQQLINGNQTLNTMMYLYSGCSNYQPKFVAAMDLNAGNDLQGVKGVIDFTLLAEQCRNNWFDPEDSDDDYHQWLNCNSTTPIKFECYDSNDRLQATPDSNVCVVLTGPNCWGGLKFTLNSGLTCIDGHYQLNFDGNKYGLSPGGQYTASIYNGSRLCSQTVYQCRQ
ncbi:hypothetical protein PP175_13180 [Aneurinibacillus sp. Ricciae_BoGa-3]|uniref:hypothetical protein n=1 Tax=Aneurinibacillus sp. Ricciae_BoGa-3 TaxID=3022697 RepID=UPI0023403196|nr:hypothetical protein [Aneurinibacillus sp. Ricciae_BoGa-3]WCK52411.1 hypothetical protein PP175_13180 [Aneurinibacillus sp. Ricciae_BoGa-3]